MAFNKVIEAIQTLADFDILAAVAAVEKLDPHVAAMILDDVDVVLSGAILAGMNPARAASVVELLPPTLMEVIFDDMGEPWEEEIKAFLQ